MVRLIQAGQPLSLASTNDNFLGRRKAALYCFLWWPRGVIRAEARMGRNMVYEPSCGVRAGLWFMYGAKS